MALSGKTGADVGARWRLELEWSARQDIANNRSTVTVDLYWIGKDQYSAVNSSASKSGSITIDGTTTNFTASAGLSAKQHKKIATASKTINHGSNGDKSFSISANFGMKVSLKGTYYSSKTISGTWNLNRIPRVSGASLNKSTVNYGETVRININKADSSFRHTINGKWGSKSISIADKTTASYVDWTVPNSLMNEIPDASSSWGKIWVDTYSGNDKIGTKELRLTTKVPSNINPSFSSLTASEQNSAVGFVGGYVQGLSKIKFTINGASGTYSSSISKYTINFDGQIKGNNGVWEPSFSGRKTATATITDSRGRTASKSINIDVIPYSPPTISTLDANRNDNGKGNKIIVNRSGNLSSLNGKNQITVTVDSSPKDKNTWGDASSSTGALGGTSFSAPVTLAGTYDVGTSYDIRVRATDKFNTVVATTTVSTSFYTMSLAKDGIGIGKIWEKGTLDIADDVYIGDGIHIFSDPNDSKIILDNSSAENAGIELGSTSKASSAYLDFHSSGKPHDYDARVIVKNGSATARAKGDMDIIAGSIAINGVGSGDVLWEGVVHMYETDAIKPRVNIKDCPGGWGLLFSRYDLGSNTAGNDNWFIFYISKRWWTNGGVKIPMMTSDGVLVDKYIYANRNGDGKLAGHAKNKTNDNKKICLREVFAW